MIRELFDMAVDKFRKQPSNDERLYQIFGHLNKIDRDLYREYNDLYCSKRETINAVPYARDFDFSLLLLSKLAEKGWPYDWEERKKQTPGAHYQTKNDIWESIINALRMESREATVSFVGWPRALASTSLQFRRALHNDIFYRYSFSDQQYKNITTFIRTHIEDLVAVSKELETINEAEVKDPKYTTLAMLPTAVHYN